MNYFWDENLSVIYCRLINIQFEILTKNIKSLLCYSISHYEGNFHLFVFLYPQWLISGYINISHASININEMSRLLQSKHLQHDKAGFDHQ